jgi:hypothetical protein
LVVTVLVGDDASGIVLVGLTEVVGATETGGVIMPRVVSDSLIDEDTTEVLCGVTETAEDTMVVTVLVGSSGVVVVEIAVGVGVTDKRVPESSLEVPVFTDGSDSVGKGETVVVSSTLLYTEVVTVLVKPGEGDSVGEGVVLVVSIPEGDTMVVTLAVEPSIRSV